jgi:hypothetical protein
MRTLGLYISLARAKEVSLSSFLTRSPGADIMLYEGVDEAGQLHPLTVFKSNVPQSGIFPICNLVLISSPRRCDAA